MGSAGSYLQTFTAVAVLCLFYPAGSTESLRPEVRGKAGGAVELECNFPASNPVDVSSASLRVVEWVRHGLEVPVLIKFGPHASRVHPKFDGRVSLVRTTALRLEALQLDDQGSYDCRILLLNESADELQNGTWILLSVTAPPTFTEAPPPVLEALVGSQLSLRCGADGNPAPSITWLKDGSVIQRADDKEGVLSLGAVSIQSAGQYTCHASNSEGNVTRVTKVKIKGPPVIVIPPKSISVNMSQNAFLRCQAVADPPNMTYIWQKDGENVYHVESLKSRVKIMVDGTLLVSGLVPGDSGNYTCMPTNGLLTPPTASANLTVMHPALALQMPPKTYLPMGMEGVVTCPVAARPPLLHVDWMKDGEPLDLSMYPGWTLTAEGSLLMATVNDDTAGVYTCTPYNSYGTMGSSGSTNVILQDPPSFSVTPEKQYKQEAGRTLLIPCQGKDEDPTIKVTWSKVDLMRRTSYSIEPNGSLLLQPVTKDHQGAWECTATNRVASVKASTQVFVLGTSPHAATSLSISPGVKQANISWEAGFDGGSAQTFSVWVKRISASDNDKRQDWFSVPVTPPNGTSLQVTGLSPSAEYQFSVLSQNKMGTGPFSEIATAWTLDLTPRRSKLRPPASLSSQRGPAGVVLRWSLPEAQQPPITGFVLQSRNAEQGEWLNLDAEIGANSSEIVVPGLHKDCVYELRLLSRRGELLSEPSPSVNVSTVGMESYPLPSPLLEFVPEPLLAGVLGGVGFMCLALALLLGSACVINHKRNRRRRQRKDDSPPAMCNCSPSLKASGTGSPDSMLKKSLLPACVLYPTTSSTTSYSSSSSRTDRSVGSKKNHQRKNPSTNSTRGRLNGTASSPVSSPIELISRDPDGRFILPQFDSQTLIVHDEKRFDQISCVRSSVSLHSEGEDGKAPPFVLSVELPPCKGAETYASQQILCSAQRLPNQGPRMLDREANYDVYPDCVSVCSNSSWTTVSHHDRVIPFKFPVLPHIRSSLGQPSSNSSALLLQMEHERERGNLSHCLKLAQEREELERELRKYTLERGSVRKTRRQKSDVERGEAGGYELMWEHKSSTLPHRHRLDRTASFGLSPSPFSSSSVHWEACSLVSTPNLVPVRAGVSSPRSTSCFISSTHPSVSSSLNKPLLQSEEAGGFSTDRLTLPHLSLEYQKHERVEAAPEGCDNSPQSTLLEMQTNDSRSEAQRQNSLSHGSISRLSFHSARYTERSNSPLGSVPDSSKLELAIPEPADEAGCVEMSVDEPELEVCAAQPLRPMLHQRIASHLQHGRPLTPRERREDISRSKSFNCHRPASRGGTSKVLLSPQYRQTSRDVPPIWDSKQRSKSLDSRRRRESDFLTPEAWISSLSQENCSLLSSRQPDSSLWEAPASRSSANAPSSYPAADHSSPRRSPERPVSRHDVSHHYQSTEEPSMFSEAAEWPAAYQGAAGEAEARLRGMKGVSATRLPSGDSDQDALEMEAGGSEGVPDSGSSYSSYASSGRGSMEPASGRLSVCHLSPILTSSPEGSLESTEDERGHHIEESQRRKASVDENYEWDAVDFCTQPAVHDGLLPSLDLLKPARCRSLPSMQCSTKALKNYTRLSLLPGHQSSSSAEPEPGAVLF